ncbi:SDR family NAD(P)-dependent oxidoreductase [Saccharopolyspora sp. ASAGF58]|uniref:SDR family NAD(P)-dependent oxidoreductase n=1 Tax=Saccharopolyspora sp. ASAGF58 TaxID=2719023 RepID=UPI0035303D2A
MLRRRRRARRGAAERGARRRRGAWAAARGRARRRPRWRSAADPGRRPQASPLPSFKTIVETNLVGTYNVLRLAAARMAHNDEEPDGDRGAFVLTSSVAAFDGQAGQTAYTASKAAVHGITLVAARDLARWSIRVNTIAPGLFATPMLGKLPPDVFDTLSAAVPHPRRLGQPPEFGRLAVELLENPYLNGETIRLDGAVRVPNR